MPRPLRGVTYTFMVALTDRATGQLKAAPTLDALDFRKSIDDGTLAALNNTPTVDPAGSVQVKIVLDAAEMVGDNISIICRDNAGSEWDDLYVPIQTDVLPSGSTTGTPTTTVFTSNLTEASDDVYNNALCLFVDGACKGQSQPISDYVGSTKQITVSSAYTEAPAAGDGFVILGYNV